MSDASSVSEPMSWSEIRERFPDQWIALVALDWADERDQPFYTALVAGNGSRHEALDQAKPLLEIFDQLGVFFTGDPMPATPAPLPPIVYVSELAAQPSSRAEVHAANTSALLTQGWYARP